MEFILVLFISLSITYILSYLFRRLKLPHILGHLMTGLIISLPVISHHLFADESSVRLFDSLANLGLIFLLFFIGLKINVGSLMRFSKKSVNIAFLSALVPFGLGYICGRLIGLDMFGAIILGASLSITAEAVSGAILEELHMINTRIGLIIIEAGIIDDVFEILILASIGIVVQSDTIGGEILGATHLIWDIVIFIGLIYLVRFIFIPITFHLLGKRPSHSDLFTASFIVVLLMAALSNFFELGTVIGALLAGIIVKHTLYHENKKEQEAEVADIIETITFGFLEPVFFIWVAYSANFWELFQSTPSFAYMAFFITCVATGGKLIGSVAGNVLDGGSVKEGILIGWGMNSRGAVELIAIKMALEHGLVEPIIFSSIVFMTFATTFFSPLIFMVLARYHSKLYLHSE